MTVTIDSVWTGRQVDIIDLISYEYVHGGLDEELKESRKVETGGFLQLMVNAKHKDGRPFTDAEIVQQAFTFLLAGLAALFKQFSFSLHVFQPQKMNGHPQRRACLVMRVNAWINGCWVDCMGGC